MIDIEYTQAEIPEHIKRQVKAQSAVSKAIREGILTRPDACELCGSIPESVNCWSSRGKVHKRVQIMAHHWRGYEGDAAIDIMFICTSCNLILRGPQYHNGSVSKEEARAVVLKYKSQNLKKSQLV